MRALLSVLFAVAIVVGFRLMRPRSPTPPSSAVVKSSESSSPSTLVPKENEVKALAASPKSPPVRTVELRDERETEVAQLLKDHRTEAAEQLLKRLLEENPKSAYALIALARILAAQEQRAEAEKLLRRAIDANPENREALDLLLSFSPLGDPQGEGMALLRELETNYPGSGPVMTALGRSFSYSDRPQEGIARLSEAARRPNAGDETLLSLGDAYRRSGDWSKAADVFAAVVERQKARLTELRALGKSTADLDRELIQNQLALAAALLSKGELDRAENVLSRVADAAPDHPGLEALRQRLKRLKGA